MKESIKKRIEAVRRGEIPEGYKCSDSGTMPMEWPEATIGSIIEFHGEKSTTNNEYPVLTSARSGLVLQTDYFEGQVTREENAGYNIIPYGYITYRSRSDDGRFSFNQNRIISKGIVSCFYPVFRIKEELAAPEFVLSYLNNNLGRQILKEIVGTSQLVLSEKKLSELRLPCPSVVEQQKIAEILATCDRAIELKQQLLEEKRRQKQWLMQKLLVPNSGVRMPGFENTTWEKSTIASLCTFGSSMAKSRDELSGEGDLYLHYGDIHANERYYIDAKAEYEAIPKYDGASPEKTHLHNGDVVFIDASEDYDGISKFVVIENGDGLTFISGLHTIPCHSRDDRLTLHFKRYCFQTYQFKKQMAYYANGMKVYGISERDFAKVEVVFPGHEEQVAISNVLDAISMNIELLEKEIVEIGKKKKALMQLLLTGLVRVNA